MNWKKEAPASIAARALCAALGLLTAALLSGCDPSGGGAQNIVEQAPVAPPQQPPPVYELPEILTPYAAGTAVAENAKAAIDFSNKQDGYIMAKFHNDTGREVRVQITFPDGEDYTYALEPGGGFEVFPLSGGNGEYTIRVFEQVEGTRYALVLTAAIDVVLSDEFAPFLRPNQYVNFNSGSEAVRKAAELTAEVEGFWEKIAVIYDFVITNISYDKELAETVQSGYLPDLDLILERGMGICFDYAALMTAMLRSQGIPTKLVIGYTGAALHAWISVYSEDTGWVDDVIFFNGIDWNRMDPTFAASGNSPEIAEFIGDGENYQQRSVH